MQTGTDEASFNTTTRIASGSQGSTVEGTESQGTRNGDTMQKFLVRLNNSTAVDTQLPS